MVLNYILVGCPWIWSFKFIKFLACVRTPPGRENWFFSEGRDIGNTGNESRAVKPCFFSYLVRYYNFTTLFSNGSLQNTFREFVRLDKIERRRKIFSHIPQASPGVFNKFQKVHSSHTFWPRFEHVGQHTGMDVHLQALRTFFGRWPPPTGRC